MMFYIISSKSMVDSSKTINKNKIGANEVNISPAHCLIYNENYPNEYLYIDNELDRFRYERTNYLERVQPTQQLIKYSIFTYPIKFIENKDLIKWILIPISSKRNDTFYIMNQMKNRYLCVSNSHSDIFNMRRKLDLSTLSKDFKERAKCMWRLDSQNKNNKQYIVKSLYYNEPLFASSNFFKTSILRRNVYTWYKSSSKSAQYIWNFQCKQK
jgi:hypothetical protein